jgi:drug/metabolite transporter (DMT)-like permease
MNTTTMSASTWGLLITLGTIWGASFLGMRIMLDEITVFQTVVHRVFWGAAALWIVIAIRRPNLPRNPKTWAALLVMGLLNNVIPFSLLSFGQLTVETGLTGILNAATAIWGVLIAALVFKDERLTPRRIAGVTIGFFGVATAIGLTSVLTFDPRSIAQLAIIAATVSYGCAGSWARSTLNGVSPLVSSAGMLTGSTLIMLPLTYAIDGAIPLDLEPRTWAAIAYVSLLSTALAYLLYYRILARAGAGNLLLVTLLVAPVAIALGATIRGEALGPSAYAGFALLALGLIILDGRAGHAFAKSLTR